MKTCSKCLSCLPKIDFSKSTASKDGFNSWCKACHRQYYKENASKQKNRLQKYYSDPVNKLNRQKRFVAYRRSYESNRKKIDPSFKIKMNLRSRLFNALKNNQKTGSAIQDLGCSINELKKHIESLWKPGMSWDNYGLGAERWQIDHIVSFSSINILDKKELKKVNHYSNLQPLWHKDHVIKTNKEK